MFSNDKMVLNHVIFILIQRYIFPKSKRKKIKKNHVRGKIKSRKDRRRKGKMKKNGKKCPENAFRRVKI